MAETKTSVLIFALFILVAMIPYWTTYYVVDAFGEILSNPIWIPTIFFIVTTAWVFVAVSLFFTGNVFSFLVAIAVLINCYILYTDFYFLLINNTEKVTKILEDLENWSHYF